MTKKITVQDVAKQEKQIITMIKEGKTLTAIAIELFGSEHKRRSLSRFLKQAGIDPKTGVKRRKSTQKAKTKVNTTNPKAKTRKARKNTPKSLQDVFIEYITSLSDKKNLKFKKKGRTLELQVRRDTNMEVSIFNKLVDYIKAQNLKVEIQSDIKRVNAVYTVTFK